MSVSQSTIAAQVRQHGKLPTAHRPEAPRHPDALTGRVRRRRTDQPDAPPLFCERVKVLRHLQPGGLSLAELLSLPAELQVQVVRELPVPIQERAVRAARRRRLRKALHAPRTGWPVASLPSAGRAVRQLLLSEGGAR